MDNVNGWAEFMADDMDEPAHEDAAIPSDRAPEHQATAGIAASNSDQEGTDHASVSNRPISADIPDPSVGEEESMAHGAADRQNEESQEQPVDAGQKDYGSSPSQSDDELSSNDSEDDGHPDPQQGAN